MFIEMEVTNVQEVLIFGTVISPIILAFVQLIKNTLNVPKNIIPLVALIVGLLVGVATHPFTDLDLYLRLWAGALSGLSATGLFELMKKNGDIEKGKQ